MGANCFNSHSSFTANGHGAGPSRIREQLRQDGLVWNPDCS